MLTAPIPATAQGAGRSRACRIGDIGAFEVNEAFAPVPLAWLAETGADPDRLNAHGGAIALGHPLGASGARLMTTLRAPHARRRDPLRPADDVRGRRHGQRDHPRASRTPPAESLGRSHGRCVLRTFHGHHRSVALVTGGASGLGLATAKRTRRRRRQGRHRRPAVVPAARRPSPSWASGSASPRPTSPTRPRCTAALDAAAELGAAAGRGELRRHRHRRPRPSARTGAVPARPFKQVIQVNLIGTFNVIRLAAERDRRDPGRSARSAASSSTPPRSPHSTARSARRPTRPPRAASSA